MGTQTTIQEKKNHFGSQAIKQGAGQVYQLTLWTTLCLCYKVHRMIRYTYAQPTRGFPWWLSSKESTCPCRRCGFCPWIGKTPQRRKWKPTLVFLPGKSHGRRSLAGYSPWGCKTVGHDLATKLTIRSLYTCVSNPNHQSYILNMYNFY